MVKEKGYAKLVRVKKFEQVGLIEAEKSIQSDWSLINEEVK